MATTTQYLKQLEPVRAEPGTGTANPQRKVLWRELFPRVLPERILDLIRRGSCRPWEEREVDLYLDAVEYVLASIESGKLREKRGEDVRKLVEWKKGKLARTPAGKEGTVVASALDGENPGQGNVLDQWPDPAPEGFQEILAQTVEISRLLLHELTAGQRNLVRWRLQGMTFEEIETQSNLGRRAFKSQWTRVQTIWKRVADGLCDDSVRALAELLADQLKTEESG